MPFVQFEKHEKQLCRCINFRACKFSKINTPPWVFFMFFKLYKWYQIAQCITYVSILTTFTELPLSIITQHSRLINVTLFGSHGEDEAFDFNEKVNSLSESLSSSMIYCTGPLPLALPPKMFDFYNYNKVYLLLYYRHFSDKQLNHTYSTCVGGKAGA